MRGASSAAPRAADSTPERLAQIAAISGRRVYIASVRNATAGSEAAFPRGLYK